MNVNSNFKITKRPATLSNEPSGYYTKVYETFLFVHESVGEQGVYIYIYTTSYI